MEKAALQFAQRWFNANEDDLREFLGDPLDSDPTV
jgi:hypothetical protein